VLYDSVLQNYLLFAVLLSLLNSFLLTRSILLPYLRLGSELQLCSKALYGQQLILYTLVWTPVVNDIITLFNTMLDDVKLKRNFRYIYR
jgi:hypothetical protein